MTDIRHKLVVKTPPEKVYEAVTTQEGLASWWCKQTTAKPEVGFETHLHSAVSQTK